MNFLRNGDKVSLLSLWEVSIFIKFADPKIVGVGSTISLISLQPLLPSNKNDQVILTRFKETLPCATKRRCMRTPIKDDYLLLEPKEDLSL